MDQLVKLLVEIGAAVAGALIANKVTTDVTGHSIPEHVYRWWSGIKEDILKWQKENQHRELTGKVVVWVVQKLDKLAIAPRNLERLFFKAETSAGEYINITEKDVPIEEALELFPDLADQTEMQISLID
jgi:hypothetical protein